MRLRVKTAALVAGSLLFTTTSVAHAQDQGGPNNPPAGGERTREGAVATAQFNDFRNRSLGGGGGVSSGGTRQYSCSWYDASSGGDVSDSGSADDSLSWDQLSEDWDAYELDEGAGDTLQVRVRCTDEGGTEPEWSPYTMDWTPADDEIVVDPADLAQDAWNMLDYPIPVGEAAPPLDVGTYAQLPTGFGIDDWGELTATATAGPVTSTVTASPVQQEWIIHDALRGESTFTCDQQGTPSPDSDCAWEPENSSAGQPSVHPDTGEPCFDVTILVQWAVSWEWTAPAPYGSGSEGLGSDWMSSSTCLVVAEIQAVVDNA